MCMLTLRRGAVGSLDCSRRPSMRLFSLSMYSIFTCAILLSFSSSAAIAQTPATPAVLDVDEALAVDAKIYADSYGVALEC
jgi:hypothetical protein